MMQSNPEDSLEWILVHVNNKTERVKILKKEITAEEKALHEHTKTTIENLSDEQVRMLLHEKWILPLYEQLDSMPDIIVDDLRTKVTYLAAKYQIGLVEVDNNIREYSQALSSMLDGLTGSEFDMQAYKQLKQLLEN